MLIAVFAKPSLIPRSNLGSTQIFSEEFIISCNSETVITASQIFDGYDTEIFQNMKLFTGF